MENKNWVVGLVILIIIVALSAWGFSKNKTSVNTIKPNIKTTSSAVVPSSPTDRLTETVPTADNLITPNEPYFDNNASVMEVYQPSCGWCITESSILTDLAKQGYRVKPMNAAADPSIWTKYNVSGTPTFIAANGDRLDGAQTEDKLKAFLDAHK